MGFIINGFEFRKKKRGMRIKGGIIILTVDFHIEIRLYAAKAKDDLHIDI